MAKLIAAVSFVTPSPFAPKAFTLTTLIVADAAGLAAAKTAVVAMTNPSATRNDFIDLNLIPNSP
jgi:hypothetical protein